MSTERFGGSWWGRRWVDALERLATAWQSRLPRGRDYAVKGHVISLSVQPGKISARVQGSRSKPYTTTIEVPAFREAQWAEVIRPLASEARFPAQLLIGQMPPDIEELFAEHNLHLFPVRNSEMIGSCTCPDKARPCKHIAAVHYAFGEALDRDPFLLFQLRGADRDVLIRGLRRAWFGDDAGADTHEESDGMGNAGVPIAPLSADRFNRSPDSVETMSFTIMPSEQPLLILNRLGAPSSWQLPITIHQLLGPVYEEAARRALDIALAEQGREDAAPFDDDLDDELDDPMPEDGAVVPEPAADGLFRTLQGASSAEDDDDGPHEPATALFLPGTIGGAKKTTRKAPEPEPEPERSSVLIRKGVAAVGRRRKKNRSTGSLEPLKEQEVAAAAPPPAPPAVEHDDGGGPPVVRRPGARKGRRTLDGDPAQAASPPTPAPEETVDVTADGGALRRRRRVVVPAEDEAPAPAPSVDEAAVARRRGRRRATISGDMNTVPTAEVSEREAREALDRGDGDAALAASRAAWRGGPSIPRFLAFMAATDAVDEGAEARNDEASRVVNRLIEMERPGTPPELLLVLAAGRYESAAALVSMADDPSDPAVLEVLEAFVPFALMAAVEDGEVPGRTSLSVLWDVLYARGEDAFPTMENPPAPVGAWLDWALADEPPNDEGAELLLDTARSRVHDLLRTPWAAEADDNATRTIRLAVAVAEALVLVDGDAQSRMYLDGVRDEIAPHRRLVKALERIERTSPLLSQ